MVVVKICGLADAVAVEAAQAADYIGFMFAPSRRRIAPSDAGRLARRSNGPKIVGVFVDEAPATVRAIADEVGLDFVQLCGEEDPAADWGRPVIRSVRPQDTLSWDRYQPFLGNGAILLVDAFAAGLAGGSGTVGDWRLAAEAAGKARVLLAGGLHPGNVAEAIAVVKPYGVDVSSGVETDGHKDPSKILAFIAAARAVGDQL